MIAHYERIGRGEVTLPTGTIIPARYVGPDDLNNGIIMQEVMPRAGYVVADELYCKTQRMFNTTGYSTLVNYGNMQINGICTDDGFTIYVNSARVTLPVQVNKGDIFKVVTIAPVYPNADAGGGFSYVFNQEEVMSHHGYWWRAAVNLYAIE